METALSGSLSSLWFYFVSRRLILTCAAQSPSVIFRFSYRSALSGIVCVCFKDIADSLIQAHIPVPVVLLLLTAKNHVTPRRLWTVRVAWRYFVLERAVPYAPADLYTPCNTDRRCP